MASTRDMIFTVKQLIAFVSSVMTLEPGDFLLTGTPAGVSPLNPGDIVEVSVEGVGTLSNPVVSPSAK
jgi:2-keto-4-pentenoate hydratase/2-oxohepta-3-ene-1,7-dioic acid hydratase in catechol pathway